MSYHEDHRAGSDAIAAIMRDEREARRRRVQMMSEGLRRRHAIRKQVAVTVLMRQGLTRLQAEDQFEITRGMGRGRP